MHFSRGLPHIESTTVTEGKGYTLLLLILKESAWVLRTGFPRTVVITLDLGSSCLISPFYWFLYSDVSGWVSNRLKTLHSLKCWMGRVDYSKINIFVSLKAEEGRVPLVYG